MIGLWSFKPRRNGKVEIMLGSIMFHVRRRPADYVPRKRKKKPAGKWNELEHRYDDERLPFLLELNPDGTEIANGSGVRHRLQPNVTEVGSERPIGMQAVQAQTLTLTGPTVMPRHCVIAFTENIVTLTPCSRDAHTYVDNQRIHQTTILQNGAIVKFGRMHTFRFIDPAPEERIRQRHDSNRQMDYTYDRRSPDAISQEVGSEKYRSGSDTPNDGQTSNPPSPSKSAAASPRSSTHNAHHTEPTHNYETTFDLDGNVETASLTSSRDGNRLSQYERQPRGTDPILPAVLEFLEETEEAFLHAVITDVEPSAPQFKLAPTYTLYLAARYRASTHYRPELQPTERAHRLTVMLANVATMIQKVIQERYMDASSLALWLANGSELLHMLKSDRHVSAFSTRAQDILADAVHQAFGSLVRCVSLELAPAISQFMADSDEPAKEAAVLHIFSSTMTLLRRCRVNAALTIQLFSHLFHAINAAAFNALVSNGSLCARWFGRRLKARLNALETWAERQGLEFASQCHLATIMQATHLLQAPKYNAEELATLSSTCFKLNSLQVRALLQKYQPAADEPRLPAELIENVVRVAESVADTLARADGREIRLEEEPTLNLALMLPDDGYSCEVIRGVPPGLAEFLAPLQRDGLCRMAPQPTSSGFWTIYMVDHHNNFRSPSAMSNRSSSYAHVGQNMHMGQPEIQIIKLHKSTNGMGLSIVAAKGAGQDRLGIYIESVVAGGAADADGRLTAGDQLLKVDGQSLVGITQEKAAEYLVRTGPIVTLEVAKQGAIYHGLATLLSQPSPVMTRAHKARPKSEHLEAGCAVASAQPSTSHSMGNLLSVPKHYQERLVDWDVDHTQTGAGVVNQSLINAASHYRNHYPSAGCSSSYLLAARQQNGNSHLYPESREFWPGSRPVPLIREPYLSIPRCYPDRYPPYPPVRTEIRPTTLGYDPNDLRRNDDDFVDVEQVCADRRTRVLRNPIYLNAIPYMDEQTDARNGEVATKSATEDNEQSEDGKAHIHEEENEEGIIEEEEQVAKTTLDLNLDLSGLNSDRSSDDSNKCWKSPEEVRLGCGRVAALAKHFSELGDAGLIKFRSSRLRPVISEPNIVSPRERKSKQDRNPREYKSESDLLKDDKSVATTPEKEWSMILLDIQASNEVTLQCDAPQDSKDKSKLSLAEQQQIIEQLKEFANLDNANAPLFIPDKDGATDSNESSTNSGTNLANIPTYSTKLEHIRKHSLPTILSTLRITPNFIHKENKLDKYWSLKDLMSSNEDLKPEGASDSPKYFIFPTCSRVVSAPEISHEDAFRVSQTISSTISIGPEDLDRSNSETDTASSSVNSVYIARGKRVETEKKTKFPESFIRTKKVSRSQDDLNRRFKTVLSVIHKDKMSRSLDGLTDCDKNKREPAIKRQPLVMSRRARSELDVSYRKTVPRFPSPSRDSCKLAR